MGTRLPDHRVVVTYDCALVAHMSLLCAQTAPYPTLSFTSANHAEKRQPLKKMQLRMDVFLCPLRPLPTRVAYFPKNIDGKES